MRDGFEQQSVVENCYGAQIQLGRKFKILDQIMTLLLKFVYLFLTESLVPELFLTKQCGGV